MFFRKKQTEKKIYDREMLYPSVRCSICTGEKVAGFRHRKTGKFEEIMLIRDERDMVRFLEMYGIAAEEVKYEY